MSKNMKDDNLQDGKQIRSRNREKVLASSLFAKSYPHKDKKYQSKKVRGHKYNTSLYD